MIIIELTYKTSLDKVNQLLEQHREFLSKYYDQGIFLASGPKDPRDGGIILATGNEETLKAAIKDDPFYQHDIADYKFINFLPNRYCKELEPLIE